MKHLLSVILFVIAVLASGCSTRDKSADKPTLAVSIGPEANILEELAGEYFQIVTILPNGANPETFEPTAKQRLDIAKAKAYFPINFLPFEESMKKEMDGNALIVNVSEGIEPVYGTHSHGDHVHTVADPHVWTSFRNGKQIAKNMTNALIQLDPDNQEYYQENLLTLSQRLDSLDSATEQKLCGAKVKAFGVWHPSLTYFARDYGMRQIAVGQESKESTLNSLKASIDDAKADSVKVFFFQKEYDSRQAKNISQEIGARLIIINPLDRDWETQLIEIADELSLR